MMCCINTSAFPVYIDCVVSLFNKAILLYLYIICIMYLCIIFNFFLFLILFFYYLDNQSIIISLYNF